MAMSPEQLAKMQAGRRAAHERRQREAADAAVARAKAARTAAADEEIQTMPRLGAMPGAAIEAAPEPAPAAEPTDAFGRFLAAQDEETRELLTDLELRVIFEQETAKALAAKKEQANKSATARAARHAKAEAGLISGGDLAEMALRDRNARKVRYVPELPQSGNSGELIDVGMRVDGRILFAGLPVTVTYGEWLSLREMEYRAMTAELDFEGKGRLSQLRRLVTGGLSTNLAGAPA